MRLIRHTAALVASIIVLGACAATTVRTEPTPAAPAPRQARFDFEATGCAAAASTRLTVAIIAPSWQQQGATEGVKVSASLGNGSAITEIQNRFKDALRQDFLELVTCRGLATRGPFQNFDSMMFPDRDASNLLLEPVIESTLGMVDVAKVARCKGFLGTLGCTVDAAAGTSPTSYTVNGSIQLGGRVTLTLREPLTNTRMWTKSVDLPADRVKFTGQTVYSSTSSASLDLWADRGVQTVLVPALEEAYAAVLRASDGYLNTRELQLIAVQAADVRKKASIAIPR